MAGQVYFDNIRLILRHLERVARGDVAEARDWLQAILAQRPGILYNEPYLTLLARDLGLVAGPHILKRQADGFYRPPYNCQVPHCSAVFEELFGRKTEGFFVEAGAFDGENFSNTSFLADIGWRGIYVEPVVEFYSLCKFRHAPNAGVKVENCGLSDRAGGVEIKLAAFSSSVEPDLQMAVAGMAEFSDWVTEERQLCRLEPLGNLLQRLNAPEIFDLLVLDVEGHEASALRGIDLNVWQPKVVIIELLDEHPEFGKHPGLVARAKEARNILEGFYTEMISDGSNSIFIRKEA